MQVVGELRVSNGIGGMNATDYGYQEAMFNKLGRGFQGFRAITVEDRATGLRTRVAKLFRTIDQAALASRIEKQAPDSKAVARRQGRPAVALCAGIRFFD